MAVCKHCRAEIEDGLDYCPNCGQKIEEDFGDFFEPDEGLEEEAYNIFDAPDEFDMDSLLSKEFAQSSERSASESAFSPFVMEAEEIQDIPGFETVEEPEPMELPGLESEPEELIGLFEEKPEEMAGISADQDLAELLGLSTEDSLTEIEDLSVDDIGLSDSGEADGFDFPTMEESDFIGLDGLLQGMDEEQSSEEQIEELILDEGLEELLAASEAKAAERAEKKKEKKKEKEKKSFFQAVFGNVPIDPSKKKKELTPEQIAEKKQKEAEEKKAKAEEKKLAAEEKKQQAKRDKEEKAREKLLKKEEKKAKKMEAAKQILEEMKDTRINRLGATIVFALFIVVGVVLFSGGDLFSYAVSVNNAEKSFNKALNNNVKYYNDAYNEIYGLDIRPEDQILNDKVMTVMFVNKQLNSYNSQMILKDYDAALHSLLMGLQRYGAYYEAAIPLGVVHDMDFVRTQILKELEKNFGVSEDKAELLCSMLVETGVGGLDNNIDEIAARAYNLALYEIVKESGLEE